MNLAFSHLTPKVLCIPWYSIDSHEMFIIKQFYALAGSPTISGAEI